MPNVINGFVITRKREGGMGIVYKGEKNGFRRAFKTIKIKQGASHREISRLSERFITEINILQKLSHQNIVTVYDAYTYEDDITGIKSTVLELEWLEGNSLDNYVKQNAPNGLKTDEVKSIALDAIGALAYAHKHKVLHLDIKPSNIFYTSGKNVKIIDFGISKVIGENADVVEGAEKVSTTATNTGASTFRGTIAYASPEQWSGEPVDKRSDIYSFGKTLFFLLTGSTDITSKSVADPHWSTIVKKCTELNKNDRFQTFDELRNAILNNNETVKCGNCGRPISQTSKFCPECGTPVQPSKPPVPLTKRCPNCYKEVPADTKFCVDCGHQFEKTSQRICSHCGYKFEARYSDNKTHFCCRCGKQI